MAPFEPTGDQPAAIKKLVKGVEGGEKHQTLLGVLHTHPPLLHVKGNLRPSGSDLRYCMDHLALYSPSSSVVMGILGTNGRRRYWSIGGKSPSQLLITYDEFSAWS